MAIRAFGRWVTMPWFAVAMLAAGGCSSGSLERSIDGARVEHELPAAKARRAVGPVPVIIGQSRPVHSARGTAARAMPRRLADASPAAAQASGLRSEVEGAIAEYLHDFNRHDTTAVVAHWSEAGENIDLDSGETTTGRDAVRGVFAALFDQDAEATIDIDVKAVRPVRRDVALVDGTSTVRFGDGSCSGSRFSAVMVRQDGRWLLDSVREAARPVSADADGRPLDELAWLVGSWQSDTAVLTASTRCFWSAGRAFLIRTHAVASTAGDSEAAAGDRDIPALLPVGAVSEREVTEIIGWDPESQSIRSWVFTSAGKFAEGTWLRDGDGWRVRIEGRGDDVGRTAECLVARHGAEALSVRGPHDGLAAELVPVADFVRLAR